MNVHFSSETNEWYTPLSVFEPLNNEFNFTLDPCATPASAKCAKYYTIEDDGLKQNWGGGDRVY
jgi:phage N-6-adenine-methyltransferase